ncbi:hypothetical protein NL676_037241 [Syzygium grande]|nr:hypothetical protein NL676_037241 [Syzygium grande]
MLPLWINVSMGDDHVDGCNGTVRGRYERFCKGWRWISSEGYFRRSAWSECPVCSAGFIVSTCGLYESTVRSTGLSKLRQCASMNYISSFSGTDAAFASSHGGSYSVSFAYRLDSVDKQGYGSGMAWSARYVRSTALY